MGNAWGPADKVLPHLSEEIQQFEFTERQLRRTVREMVAALPAADKRTIKTRRPNSKAFQEVVEAINNRFMTEFETLHPASEIAKIDAAAAPGANGSITVEAMRDADEYLINNDLSIDQAREILDVLEYWRNR